MTSNTNFLDLPTQIKLQILLKLEKTEVMLCRKVCKGFVPRDFGLLVYQCANLLQIRARLNLSPNDETFTSYDWNELTGIHKGCSCGKLPDCRSCVEVTKTLFNVANLEDAVPVSFMGNINVIGIRFISADWPALTMAKHCSNLKMFIVNLDGINRQRLAEMFTAAKMELTHLIIYGTDTGMEFDCALLRECNRLQHLRLPELLPTAKSIDKLPTSIKELYITSSFGIQELDWISSNLLELHQCHLFCNPVTIIYLGQELGGEDETDKFCVELFKKFCNLPSLTAMSVGFRITPNILVPALGPLLGRLKQMVDLCYDDIEKEFIEGVDAQFTVLQDRRHSPMDLDILVRFELVIEHPKFKGLGLVDNF